MQHDHVLKKFNFDLLNPSLGSGGGGSAGKIFATILLRWWFPFIWYATLPCSEKVEFRPLPQGRGGVRGLSAKYLLVCCCICDSLKFDMQHDHVLKMLKFDLLNPPPGSWGEVGGVSVGKKICYHVAAFIIPLNLICKMTMLWRILNFDLLDPP